LISKEAVVKICDLLADNLMKDIGEKRILLMITDLRKVKANKSYQATMEAIEEELRWRFGKDW
jgi:hypothetical protein